MLFISDRQFVIFRMIEERGLQFLLAEHHKPLYKLYLKQKKFNKLLELVEREAMENRDE